MTAPSSLARVYAAAKRLMPRGLAAWEDDASAVLRELATVAWTMARATDRVEAMFDELFPDSATETLDRWERLFGIAVRPADSIETRQTRLIATMGRVAGNTLDQLSLLLAPLLGIDASQMQWVEVLRTQIDAALTETTGAIADAVTTSGVTYVMGRPWPGVVDGLGISVYLNLSGLNGQQVTVTHPDGTAWTFAPSSANGWTSNRVLFAGKPAAGRWKVSVRASLVASVLSEARLMVSNDVDAAQIYSLRLFADPAVAMTPDLSESMRVLKKTAVAHVLSLVTQQRAIFFDTPLGRHDRDPVGS